MSGPLRLVVVDDQEVVRAGFAALLDTQPDLAVVATAADGAAALRVCREQRPDVVRMDVRMPAMDGIEATRRVSAASSATRIIMLTTFDRDEFVHDALRAGASGFLLKDTPPGDLLDAIRIVAAGEALLAPTVTKRLIEDFLRRPMAGAASPEALDSLTDRELEVLRLVAQGFSNAEIAETLVLSPATAKTHVSRILAKLGARDRAQLVVIAYQTGLIAPG